MLVRLVKQMAEREGVTEQPQTDKLNGVGIANFMDFIKI